MYAWHVIAHKVLGTQEFRQTTIIRRTGVDNKCIDHSDVVEASPVGVAQTSSSFSTQHLASMNWAKTTAKRDDMNIQVMGFGKAISGWSASLSPT